MVLNSIRRLSTYKSLTFSAEAVKITISGNVGVGGVEMFGLPGKVISEEDGSYSVIVEYNFSAKVTPKKEGYTFDPPSYDFQGVTYDQYQDFTSNAKQFVISGKIDLGNAGLGGVLLEGFDDNVYTNADGSYSVSVDYDFSASIKPVLAGFSFKPGTMTYTKVRDDKLKSNEKVR